MVHVTCYCTCCVGRAETRKLYTCTLVHKKCRCSLGPKSGTFSPVLPSPPQIRDDIEKFKSQGVEMEEKRKDILRGLEVSIDRAEHHNSFISWQRHTS